MTEEGKKFRAAITATARFLPDKVVSNADMERLVDTSDGWIRSRTGISERRFLPADEPTSTMAIAVAQELLARRGIAADDIDLIIVATITPDMIFRRRPAWCNTPSAPAGCGPTTCRQLALALSLPWRPAHNLSKAVRIAG